MKFQDTKIKSLEKKNKKSDEKFEMLQNRCADLKLKKKGVKELQCEKDKEKQQNKLSREYVKYANKETSEKEENQNKTIDGMKTKIKQLELKQVCQTKKECIVIKRINKICANNRII